MENQLENPDGCSSCPEKPSEVMKNPMAEVMAIRDQVLGMGANDNESESFRVILEALQRNEITGEEAVRRARDIFNSKQDYH